MKTGVTVQKREGNRCDGVEKGWEQVYRKLYELKTGVIWQGKGGTYVAHLTVETEMVILLDKGEVYLSDG